MSLTPDKLLQAASIKNTLTTPTAEGAKDTTVEVVKGAAKGAATGGWVGAARGAAVSFAKTKAGRRTIAVLLTIVLVTSLTVPALTFLTLTAAANAASFGDQFRAGQAATDSGNEAASVTAAMSTASQFGVQWPLLLAMDKVMGEGKTNIPELAKILNAGTIRTLGAGASYVSGLGLTAGKTDADKKLAEAERNHYLSALVTYGLTEAQAERVYTIALKWALGEVEECGIPSDSGPAEPSSIVTSDGKEYKLSEVQIGNIQAIIGFASKVEGITPDAIQIILMAASVESNFKNYANSKVPESLKYPHDAVGSDHDSVGFWQMRQHWGTTAELMDIEYQVKAILGGKNGPNKGSPRGLFDIKGWEKMPKGEAAQAVEVSAFPDRYAERETLAASLLQMFGTGINFCDGGIGEAGAAGHPLGDSSYLVSSKYGLRNVNGCGNACSNHRGLDFSAACKTPIYAIADGKVIYQGPEGAWGNVVKVQHANGLMTRSAHQPDGAWRAPVGTVVKAGDQIGMVGNTGRSFGCHLHLETVIDGKYYDPEQILLDMGIELKYRPGL